ncbi:hypothetical protein [Streptomyces mirabilis]|uniref:hypothetical protein n=1 Tax=Streptomyces mirabilis TaxID=68239 RepID=UPI0036DEE386
MLGVLTQPDLTRIGVWAATTAPDRSALRRRLENRLGPDWVNVIAAQTPSSAPPR